ARLREQRRRDARLRRVRGLDALGARAREIELRDAARVAAGEPDRLGDAPRRVAPAEQDAPRRGGGAEADAGAGRLEAAAAMRRLHSEPDPDRALVAGAHGRHELARS